MPFIQPLNLQHTVKPVPPCGPRDADIVVVGEAPGKNEVLQGRPFVGNAGAVLNDILRSAGIPRSTVYFTNVVKEQPPHNQISHFISLAKGIPRPTAAYTTYEDALYDELRDHPANVVVACGNVALWALCRKTGITKWRGSILPAVDALGGRKVVPTLHPSVTFHDPPAKYTIMADFGRVKQEATFSDIRYPVRDLRINPTLEEALDFLASCSRAKMVAFDIETDISTQQISCISFAPTADLCMSVPLLRGGNDRWTPSEEVRLWSAVADLLEDPHVRKVAQNANFDCTILYHFHGIAPHPVDDTMVAQAILYPDLPKGLDYLASMYTDEPYYKDEGKEIYTGKISVTEHEEEFWRYNAKDSAVTREVWTALADLLLQRGQMETYLSQNYILPSLMFMQEHGFVYDLDLLRELSLPVEEKISALREELEVLAPGLNVNSPKQLREFFAQELRRRSSKSCDQKTLLTFARNGNAAARIILAFKHNLTLKSRYLDMKSDPDGRMRTHYKAVGTVTGRLSSTQTLWSTGGNFQNLPPAFRPLLTADPGYFMVEMDLDQAENRIVASIGVPRMAQAFADGTDIHSLTYSLMFGIPLEDVSREPGSSPLGDGTWSQRAWGKKFNHSLNYGIGPVLFANAALISVAEAKQYIELYHQVYPGVRDVYQAAVLRQLKANRTVENLYGRKRIFMGYLKKSAVKAFSYLAQSTVADKINRDGLIFLSPVRDLFPELQLLNQIHDSIVFQLPLHLPRERLLEILETVALSLESPIPSNGLSIPVSVKVGPSFGNLRTMHTRTLDALNEALDRM